MRRRRERDRQTYNRNREKGDLERRVVGNVGKDNEAYR